MYGHSQHQSVSCLPEVAANPRNFESRNASRSFNGGKMTQDNSESVSNQDRLKALRSPAPAPSENSAATGPLPWDSKPVSPEVRAVNISEEAPDAEQIDQIASPSVLIPPSVHKQGPEGKLYYWNGNAWDPRPLAGTWSRIGCWIVDSILAFIVAFITVAIISICVGLVVDPGSMIDVLYTPVLIGAYLCYFACSYVWWGRTPGMMLGRLDVISLTSGQRLSWGRAWLRSLVLALANVSGILALIWVSIASGNPRKQGPHDSAARSLVLQRNRV